MITDWHWSLGAVKVKPLCSLVLRFWQELEERGVSGVGMHELLSNGCSSSPSFGPLEQKDTGWSNCYTALIIEDCVAGHLALYNMNTRL